MSNPELHPNDLESNQPGYDAWLNRQRNRRETSIRFFFSCVGFAFGVAVGTIITLLRA